ncbi:MAG: hypothetical protein KGY67_00425 [Candidatus Thermoplasmatota archaeon]|nr:hypothetical protein [Candidatus Thermoplasmatota archaeon]
MYNQWFKMGKGGSYSGYIKPRNPINKVSKAQRDQRARFRAAALRCKGKDQAEFRQCMSEAL